MCQWALDHADQQGWDAERVSVGGASAGAKLSMNLAQYAHDTATALRAAVLSYAVADCTRTDRTSPKANAAISPTLQKLSARLYFVDPASHDSPVASPYHDTDLPKKMPPTLIQTGDLDTLGPEMVEIAGPAGGRRRCHPHRLPGRSRLQHSGKPRDHGHLDPRDRHLPAGAADVRPPTVQDGPEVEHVVAALRERMYGAISCLATLAALARYTNIDTNAWFRVIDVAVAAGGLWAAALLAEFIARLSVEGKGAAVGRPGRCWHPPVRSCRLRRRPH